MPINLPENLPATEILNSENIFVMSEERAGHQDIRALEIAILNLMPTKITTETQLLRLLGNTAIQVNITLLHPSTYTAKNTPQEHLTKYYQTFEDVRNQKFDGLVITGAPVEQLDFEEVSYWEELKEIMDWSLHHVYSILYICWGAQAGLYHHYGVGKYPLESKLFGVFEHKVTQRNAKLLRGFDDVFYAPHSRYTEIKSQDIEKIENLDILSQSDEAGSYILSSKDGRQIFVTGHSEYDALTLKSEYDRDIAKDLPIEVPVNYFPDNDPQNEPIVKWRGHANLLFSNWLNYFVYQETPYNLENFKMDSP